MFISPTDSSCTAALFNPDLVMKNILLKQLVCKTLEYIERVFIYLPFCVVHLTWIPGSINPSDHLSKLVLDPIKWSNSEFMRFGPKEFKSKKELMTNTFMTITCNGKIWKGLPEEVTKVNENASRLKMLASLAHDDVLENNETVQNRKKIENCLLCNMDRRF